MREDHHHHEIQTPKKDQSQSLSQLYSNRKAKPLNAASKKHQKNTKRSLNSAFAPKLEDDVVSDKISLISEDVDEDLLALDIGKVSLISDEVEEESVVSEVLCVNEDQSSESIESYIGSVNQFISPSPATPSPLTTPFSSTSLAESTPLSCISITTAETTPLSSPIIPEAVTICVPSHNGVTADEMNLLKVEEAVKNLREIMFQVFHSADIEPRSKKVLDALVKIVNEEFYSVHEERNIVVKLFSNKLRIVLLSLLGMLAVSAGLFVFSDVQGYDHGPSPT